jgi:hypothetical protein
MLLKSAYVTRFGATLIDQLFHRHPSAMKQYIRFALLTALGLACWLVLRWRGGRYMGSGPRNNLNDLPENNVVVDFSPRFRVSGVVDETFEAQLYDSLSALEGSIRHETVNEWPKFIWQTSPGRDISPEMNSWKAKNPEWSYKVFPLVLTG